MRLLVIPLLIPLSVIDLIQLFAKLVNNIQSKEASLLRMLLAVRTRFELVTSCVTGRHSNQLNYHTV